MQFKRVLGTAGIGLAAIVWALVQAAEGDLAFYALAAVLTLVTNLSIVELSEKRPRAARVMAMDVSSSLTAELAGTARHGADRA